MERFLDWILRDRRHRPATAEAYRRDISRFIAFVQKRHGGPVRADQISSLDIEEWLASAPELSSTTVRRRLYSASSFMRHLTDRGIIPLNPAARIEPPEREESPVRVPTRDECLRILGACRTPRELVAISLLLFAGLRRSEMLGLNVDDLGPELQTLRVVGKGGKSRTVPINEVLRAILRDSLDTRCSEDPALILNAAGRRMAASTFWRMFQRILQRAGLEDWRITAHCLRHRFATQLGRTGTDLATIAALIGHANVSTTSCYLHTDDATKQAAVERLQEAFREGASGE